MFFVLAAAAPTVVNSLPGAPEKRAIALEHAARKSYLLANGSSELTKESVDSLKKNNLTLVYQAQGAISADFGVGDEVPKNLVDESALKGKTEIRFTESFARSPANTGNYKAGDLVPDPFDVGSLEKGAVVEVFSEDVKGLKVEGGVKPGLYSRGSAIPVPIKQRKVNGEVRPTLSFENATGTRFNLDFKANTAFNTFENELKNRKTNSGTGGEKFKKARIVGLVAGVGSIVLGSLITGFDLAQSLSCNQALNREFSALSGSGLFTKMACEVGAVEGELATLRQAYDQLKAARDSLVVSASEDE